MSKPVTRRIMTADEFQAVERMHCVTFPAASWDKRFFRSIAGAETISDKEASQLWRLFIRYRRQMSFPDQARLLALAEKLAAPDFRKQQAAARALSKIEHAKRRIEELKRQQQPDLHYEQTNNSPPYGSTK